MKLLIQNLLSFLVGAFIITILINSYMSYFSAFSFVVLWILYAFYFGRYSMAVNDRVTTVYCFPFYFYRVDSVLVERVVVTENCIAVHLVSGRIKKVNNLFYDARNYISDQRVVNSYPIDIISITSK